MKNKKFKFFFFVFSTLVILNSCRKDPDPLPEEEDTTTPVITVTSPDDNTVYHNGDTVHMIGTVTDNELHNGTLKIIDDTTAFEYYSYSHYVHEQSSAVINFDYIVTGVTQNTTANLSFFYEDHYDHTVTVNRHLIFMP